VILQEDDAFVASKTKAALDCGLGVILCCGESLEQRENGSTVEVVTKQLKAVADKVKDWSKIVVAYEPIWYASQSPSTNARQSNNHTGPSAPAKSRPPSRRKKCTRRSAPG
jgi:triosephosphate isomerase